MTSVEPFVNGANKDGRGKGREEGYQGWGERLKALLVGCEGSGWAVGHIGNKEGR